MEFDSETLVKLLAVPPPILGTAYNTRGRNRQRKTQNNLQMRRAGAEAADAAAFVPPLTSSSLSRPPVDAFTCTSSFAPLFGARVVLLVLLPPSSTAVASSICRAYDLPRSCGSTMLRDGCDPPVVFLNHIYFWRLGCNLKISGDKHQGV